MAEPSGAPVQQVEVREVTGVFHARKPLEEAIDDLQRAGFDRPAISLMARSEAMREKLGEAYGAVGQGHDVPHVPAGAFVLHDDWTGPLAQVASLLGFIGAAGGALAVVASGGALAIAAAAAAAGGVAAGGLGALMAHALGRKEADALEAQLGSGGIILWVRILSPELEERAQQILRENGADAVGVHEIELDEHLEDIPLGSLLYDEGVRRACDPHTPADATVRPVKFAAAPERRSDIAGAELRSGRGCFVLRQVLNDLLTCIESKSATIRKAS